MATLVEVRKKAQITLPQAVRDELKIEVGDILEAKVENGRLVMSVKRLVDKDQAWFWTRRWQEGEQQVEADIKAGRVVTFDNMEDLIADLHRAEKSLRKSRKPRS
jgi:bifunctional DNA-binding transcriptional regulator/antitoxin component of YhaV-PrlF toxin-antitoxin module